MISQTSTEQQASPLTDAKAAVATDPVSPMDPTKPIETASQGSGTTNDPPGTDNKPPGAGFTSSDFVDLLS
jgi:hypothetical protein